MISDQLISLLACPETKQPLHRASQEVLAHFSKKMGSQDPANANQGGVGGGFEEILVRADGKKGYPVRNGIPILLIDEAISIDL